MTSRQSDDPNARVSDAAGTGSGPRNISRNSKRTGELSEAAFLHKAVGLGFRVTKPWGDSERYDFVLDAGPRLWRVQIKCTAMERSGGYQIQPIHFVYGKSKVVYTAEDIDVLAAHIVPLDVWYVVPVGALAQGTSLQLYPDDRCKTARFEKYREAWDLFRGGGGADAVVEKEYPVEEPSVELAAGWRPVWKPRFFGMR